jgi:hypothetical protein
MNASKVPVNVLSSDNFQVFKSTLMHILEALIARQIYAPILEGRLMLQLTQAMGDIISMKRRAIRGKFSLGGF